MSRLLPRDLSLPLGDRLKLLEGALGVLNGAVDRNGHITPGICRSIPELIDILSGVCNLLLELLLELLHFFTILLRHLRRAACACCSRLLSIFSALEMNSCFC